MDSIHTQLTRPNTAVSRRAVLGAGATGVALALLNPRGGQVAAQNGEDLTHVFISVHAPGGAHYDGEANVLLRQGDTQIALQRALGSVLYEAMVEPGTYSLEVSGEGLVAPVRLVEVGSENRTASAYLGEQDWPYYRLGENIIPFEPRENLLAVVFETAKLEPDDARAFVAQQGDLGLTPLEIAPDAELPFAAANGAIWLFELSDPADREQATAALRERLQREVRIGMPVDLTPGQVKVLDNRYIVRFQDQISAGQIEELIQAQDAVIIRDFVQSPNARLIAFPESRDFRDQLEVIESWIGQGLLVYGEPDLLAEITDAEFPADAPDDPSYLSQINLPLQGVDEAWRFLHSLNPDWTLGSHEVYVATLDRGVEVEHDDTSGPLTDGEMQLARCFDFLGMQGCEEAGYKLDSDHGMGVYGIIAARTDNETMIAGIAPNTHQIGLRRPDVDSAIYKDVLLWTAGIVTGNRSRESPQNWPEEPIDRAADIINCSHVVRNMPQSGIVDETLTFLTDQGRNGLGTILVYSAGNDTSCMTGLLHWATHSSTLAIASSRAPNGEGIEIHESNSNWGPEVDLCATGAGVLSLVPDNDPPLPFGGTSAAAPTVAAAVALMLTANPNLTWSNVRQILCDTAEKIDPDQSDINGVWDDDDFSQWYGHGRLNVCEAVKAAHAFVP